MSMPNEFRPFNVRVFPVLIELAGRIQNLNFAPGRVGAQRVGRVGRVDTGDGGIENATLVAPGATPPIHDVPAVRLPPLSAL